MGYVLLDSFIHQDKRRVDIRRYLGACAKPGVVKAAGPPRPKEANSDRHLSPVLRLKVADLSVQVASSHSGRVTSANRWSCRLCRLAYGIVQEFRVHGLREIVRLFLVLLCVVKESLDVAGGSVQGLLLELVHRERVSVERIRHKSYILA